MPKQFLTLGGMSILERTLSCFHRHPLIGEIVIVAPRAYLARVRRIKKRGGYSKVTAVVSGASERQGSVWQGLNAFVRRPSVVLVHDAVRPFVDRSTVSRVVRAARQYGAAVVATPVRDTVKLEGKSRFFLKTLPREKLWAVQTPQGFRYHLIIAAHRGARMAGYLGTDEASLIERMGRPVRIIPGKERNMKITTVADLAIARSWVPKRD
jgi:2-C-methyl-D-erythritol 4-phosphate cytidylyltransferase